MPRLVILDNKMMEMWSYDSSKLQDVSNKLKDKNIENRSKALENLGCHIEVIFHGSVISIDRFVNILL